MVDAGGVAEKGPCEKGLAQFLQGLDGNSRAILSYLWWNRHAGISDLRNIDPALDDYEVLYRLKEVINKKSYALWGKPIVSFYQSKIDPISGEKIVFSWWLTDEEDIPASSAGSGLIDVFNEEDNVVIIAQLPAPVDLTSPDIQFKNGILRIKLRKVIFSQHKV